MNVARFTGSGRPNSANGVGSPNRWSVYGMIRDVGRLMDDARFKQFSSEHEERLAAVWPVSSSGISKMRRFRAGKGSVAGMVPSVYLLRRKVSLFCRKLTPESS